MASGMDFLGWVHFPDNLVFRTSTKWRMLAKVDKNNVSSYFGLLKHGNTKLREDILKCAARC